MLQVQKSVEIPIDLVRVLRSFVSLNTKKAKFSRNRIVHGFHDLNDQVGPELFNYILKNAHIYDFLSILLHRQAIATAFSCWDPCSAKTQQNGDFFYTLILCAAENSDKSFKLEYFIIVVNKATRFPHRDVEPSNFSIDSDPLEEYIGSGYYLKDIVKNFMTRIDNLVEESLKHFDRDHLWSELYQNKVTNKVLGDAIEWSRIFSDKVTKDAKNILVSHPRLEELFLDHELPWDDVLHYL